MNIIIIAYRPDYTDICRGCRMGSTESDMEYGVFDGVDEASDFLSQHMKFNLTGDRYEYADYEFNFIINGIDQDNDDDNAFNYVIFNDIARLAKEKCNRLVDLHNIKQAELEAKKIADDAEATRQQELKTLARLQEKHGNS